MLPTLTDTPIAYLIILTTIIVGFYALSNPRFAESWRFHPFSAFRGHRQFTFITSIFIHVSNSHLIINTLFLLFGLPEIEYMFVKDVGPVRGRFLLLAGIFGSAWLTGLMLSIRYRHQELQWFAGMSSVIWSQIFIYLLYDPMVPLKEIFSFAADWPPVWIAMSLLCILIVLDITGDPAGAPHLFGALAGILFVVLVRPGAVTEVSTFIGERHQSEKCNDPFTGHHQGPRQSAAHPSEEGTFSPVPAQDQSFGFGIATIQTLWNRQVNLYAFRIHHFVFNIPSPWKDTANIEIVNVISSVVQYVKYDSRS